LNENSLPGCLESGRNPVNACRIPDMGIDRRLEWRRISEFPQPLRRLGVTPARVDYQVGHDVHRWPRGLIPKAHAHAVDASGDRVKQSRHAALWRELYVGERLKPIAYAPVQKVAAGSKCYQSGPEG